MEQTIHWRWWWSWRSKSYLQDQRQVVWTASPLGASPLASPTALPVSSTQHIQYLLVGGGTGGTSACK